jgi:hypothetical protein
MEAETQAYKYELLTRFCGTIDSFTACRSDKAAFCMLRDDEEYISVARFQSSADVKTATTTATGLKLVIENLEDIFMGQVTLMVELNCAKTASPPTSSHPPGTDPYIVNYVQSHPAACKGSTAGAGGGGLSGGSIFLIIFFASAFVYVVAGCMWNVKRNGLSPGPEACPQRAFWASIPGNVAAGLRFTANGCKRKGGYESSTGSDQNLAAM